MPMRIWIHSLRRLHWARRMQKLINWDRPVAMAAPEVPRPRPKIKMGSRAMLRMPPVVIPTMAKAARPWSRSRLFMIKEHIMKGVARKM